MKIVVDYEFNDVKAKIHEFNTLVIPIKSHIIINEETLFSIKRYILGYEGLHYGFFVIGDPKIINIKIVNENN